MNALKYLLLSSLLMFLVGIFGKSVIFFPLCGTLMIFGIFFYVLFALIYAIVALIKKRHRMEAGMMALSVPMVLGIMFKMMYWPGGGLLLVAGSSFMTVGSIGMLIYTLIKKRKGMLGILFLSIGLGSLFFCFKFMRWPGAVMVSIPFLISVIVALVMFTKRRKKVSFSHIISFVVIFLFIVVFAMSSSQLFYIRHFVVDHPDQSYPEYFHEYAWMLHGEGKDEDAEVIPEMAIQQSVNSNNVFYYEYADYSEDYVARYQRALEALRAGNWQEFEESPLSPQAGRDNR